MSNAFLNAVDAEVLAIQRRMAEYAEKHPKIAARLRHGSDVTSDPHVGRLIQAFAVLVAKTRCRLEDAFPEVIEPLLDATIHPHLADVPSLAIVELIPDPDQPPDVGGVDFPRHTEIETELIDDQCCRFRTCADVQLRPIQLDHAEMVFPPFRSTNRRVSQATCAVKLSLATMAGNIPLMESEVDSLRFYIHESTETALRIYQALFCNTIGVQVVTESGEQRVLPPDCIRPAGFASNERLLESAGQPEGERLFSEMIALPERFLFFEIHGLESAFRNSEETQVDLNILLDITSDDFPVRIPGDAIRLNCVPAVNLYVAATEPVEVDGVQGDIRLVVDSRNLDNDHITRIRRVTVRDEDESVREVPPFHTIGHDTGRTSNSLYWTRLPDSDHGANIRFVGLSGTPAELESGIVESTVLCSNGKIPNRISEQPPYPRLQPVSPGVVAECRFLTRPTPSLKAVSIDVALKLVARALPHFSSGSSRQNAQRFRNVLALLFRDSETIFAGMVQAITNLQIQRVSGIHHRRMVCHGLEIHVTLEERKSVTAGMYLFAEVLRHLFAGYASEHTFVRYKVTTTSGQEFGIWPTTDGERFFV